MQNPQQLYDNWAKFKSNPQELARTANDEVDESKAYIVFKEIMNGKEAEAPDEATREFVLSLRKLMLRDEFIKGTKKYQNKFLDYVEKALNSLELRTVLDQVSSAGDDTKLDPQVPLPPYQPQPMPMPGMMPMGAPGVPPGQPPQPGGQAPLPGAPASPLAGLPTPGMQVPPQPGQMQAPLPNPMAPPQMGQQGNVSALPPM
jgi:hypothetical protein